MNILSLFDGMSCGQIALNRVGIKFNKYYASEIDKHAIKVTQANYPNTIQLGSVSNWESWKIEQPDLILGGFPCFKAGTKIISKDEYKNIENIKIGDYVLTHKNRFKKVLNLGSKENKIWIVKAQGTKEIRTTSNHPFYVRSIKRTGHFSVRTFSEPKWVEVKDLKKGDFLGLPIIKHEENKRNLSEEDCWLIGRYLADGHLFKRKRKNRKNSFYYGVVYSIGSKKLEEFKSNVSRHLTYHAHSKSTYRGILNSKIFFELLEDLNVGKGAKNKKIPMEILLLPVHLLKKVIEGYMSGDGSSNDSCFSATSISEELILTLNLAIAKVYGVSSSFDFFKRPKTHIIEGRIVNQNDTYMTRFRSEVKKQSHYKIIDDIIWVPLTKVFETNEISRVYNFEVEDDNSYVADNCIVHNCQAFSTAGKQLGLNDIRGQLLYYALRIIKHYKPKHFILENVKGILNKKFKSVINLIYKELEASGYNITHTLINSALISAQNRQRVYFTNFLVSQPGDKGILLKDIIQDGTGVIKNHGIYRDKNDKSQCIDANYYKGIDNHGQRTVVKCGALRGRNIVDGKRKDYKGAPTKQRLEERSDGKTNSLTTIQKDNILIIKTPREFNNKKDSKSSSSSFSHKHNNKLVHTKKYLQYNLITKSLESDNSPIIRKLTPLECERLQTVPDNYTNHVSDSQRYKMLGNGWTVDVIVHILNEMQKNLIPNKQLKLL